MATTRYKQYKECTDFVRISLTETAKQYGYFDTHPSKKYTISSRDYIPLAKHINQHETSVSYLPIDFFPRLRRALALRRQEHDIRSRRGTEDEGHLLFIDILEGVHDTLALQERLPREFGRALTATTGPQARDFSYNGPSPSTKRMQEGPQIIFELQDDGMQGDEEERLLVLTWLVDDLHEIKSHVKELWSRYKDRELDLVTTSLGTNAAIEWAQEIESEYSEVLGDASNIAYLQGLLWARHCIAQGHDPARSLDDGKLPDSIHELSTHFFWSVRVLLEAYLDLRVAGTLPFFKQNYYGNPDVFLTSPSPTKGHQKFHVDKALLMEILPHFDAVTRMDGLHPYQDAIVTGLCTMFQDGRVPLWLSFSVQVFLDIQYELGPQVDQGFSDLIGNAATLERSLEATLSSQKAHPSGHWPVSGIFVMEKLAAELRTLQSKDLIRKVVSVGMVEGPEGIVFGTVDHQLLKVHPLTCGLWLYSLRARYHDLGVRLANADETIVGCAHVYHALKREGILHEAWPDMELLLDIHNVEQVFAGPVPQEPVQYVTQYRATLDQMFPEQGVQSSRGHGDRPTRDDRPLRFGATATRLFMNRYVTRHPGCTNSAIHEALQILKTGEDWGHSIPESECYSPFARRLNDLCGMIRREAIEFYFDYFQFRQFCWLVLFSIQQTIQAIQGPAGVKIGSQNDGQNPSVITGLFQYLIDFREFVRRGRYSSELEDLELPGKVVLAVGTRLDGTFSQMVDSRACRCSEVVAERVSRVCHTNLLQQLRRSIQSI